MAYFSWSVLVILEPLPFLARRRACNATGEVKRAEV